MQVDEQSGRVTKVHLLPAELLRAVNQVPREVNQLPREVNKVPRAVYEVLIEVGQLPRRLNKVRRALNEVAIEVVQLPRSLNEHTGASHSRHHLAASEPVKTFLSRYETSEHSDNIDVRGDQRDMSIQKLEFYEGAALFRLIRSLGAVHVRIDDGVVFLNDQIRLYLKYCTRTRSPWSFTFSSTERHAIASQVAEMPLYIGLVCGSDGVAAMERQDYLEVAGGGESPIAISCARRYDEHYSVSGPAGVLARKIAPSAWNKIHLPGK